MIALPLAPTCPAAEVIRGASPGRAAVVCGVKKLDAARTDGILEKKEEGVVVYERDDFSTVHGLCCGPDAPPTDPTRLVDEALRGERPKIPASYVCCNVWEAEKKRLANERVFGKFERPEVPEGEEDPLGEQRFTRAELDALVGRG